MYLGIDYGNGKTNIDLKTGIRYGVISQNEVLQAWCDSNEPYYVYNCPFCGSELKKGADAKRCPSCYKKIDPDVDFDMLEPVSFFIDDGEYQAEQTYDDPDIFITKSPYYTFCQFCSPCAPGAGYLMSPIEDFDTCTQCHGTNNVGLLTFEKCPHCIDGKIFKGVKAYCFDSSFFEEGKAPYPIYSVKTNEEVLPDEK